MGSLGRALDARQNQVTLVVAVDTNLAWSLGQRTKRMIFEHLVDFHYAADVADPPPAHFNKMMLEIIAHEDELHEDEGHWLHGNGLYDRYLPLYRVSVQAWEFTLKIICRNIRFEELPAEE